jgi:hypothetical protein
MRCMHPPGARPLPSCWLCVSWPGAAAWHAAVQGGVQSGGIYNNIKYSQRPRSWLVPEQVRAAALLKHAYGPW